MIGSQVAAVVWLDLGLSLLVLAAMWLTGGIVLRLFRIDAPRPSAGLAFPLGLGLTAWVLFLASWAGIPLDRGSVLRVWAGLTLAGAIALAATRAAGRTQPAAKLAGPTRNRAADTTVAVFLAALLIVAGSLSVGRSYSGWDDMSAYATQGYAIARLGSVHAVAEWGPAARGYPITVPLAIAGFRLLGLEALPGSKLIFPTLLVSALAACYGYWRAWRVPPWLAAAGVIVIGTTPTIFEHGTLGYTNLPAAIFATLGTMCAVEGMERNHRGTLATSGVLLGICAFTRPEGLLMALVVLGCGAAAYASRKRQWPPALLSLGLLGTVAIPWMVYAGLNGLGTQMSEASTSAIDQIAQGSLHLDAVYWTLRYLVRSAVKTLAWGTLPLFAAVILLVGVTRTSWKAQVRAVSVLAAGLGAGTATVVFYYLVSFGGDVRSWLGTGVERMFLLPVILTFVGIVGLTGAAHSPSEAVEGLPAGGKGSASG